MCVALNALDKRRTLMPKECYGAPRSDAKCYYERLSHPRRECVKGSSERSQAPEHAYLLDDLAGRRPGGQRDEAVDADLGIPLDDVFGHPVRRSDRELEGAELARSRAALRFDPADHACGGLGVGHEAVPT